VDEKLMLLLRIKDFFKTLLDKGFLSTLKLLFSTFKDRVSNKPFARETVFEPQDVNPEISPYLPSRYEPLVEVLKRISFSSKDVFVDVGAGKGRAMIIASKMGFKKVKGIELSRPLFIKANKILEKANLNYELINSNILDYKIKEEDNFFYLYDPFQDDILKAFLNNLVQSNLKVRILYHNNISNKSELFCKFPNISLNSSFEIMGNHYSLFHLN
tara:strand:- start:41092 stop:41736 length:645 start_codon:yes stop_codon:yes gene_type:complete